MFQDNREFLKNVIGTVQERLCSLELISFRLNKFVVIFFDAVLVVEVV